jgi:hypothetical protein
MGALLKSERHTRKNKNNVRGDRGRSKRNYAHLILRTLCNLPAALIPCAWKPREWKTQDSNSDILLLFSLRRR